MLEWLFKRKQQKQTGSYGKSIILLSSDPAEIERICDRLGEEYITIMELTPMANHDYIKVIIREVKGKNSTRQTEKRGKCADEP